MVNHFRVFIHGQNFVIEVDGELKPMGFFTTRFVEAENHDQAEGMAVQLLRDFQPLRDEVKNPEDDRPELVIEETEELQSLDGIADLEPPICWYDPAAEDSEAEDDENTGS